MKKMNYESFKNKLLVGFTGLRGKQATGYVHLLNVGLGLRAEVF